MNDYQDSLRRFRTELRVDAAGRLYEPVMRELVAASPTARALEALAALRLASRAMNHALERWADEHGLSGGTLGVIFRLSKAPGRRLPLGELAEALDVSPRNITGLVDHLERDGLVRRVADPHDRRSILAELTEEGVRRARKAVGVIRRQAVAVEGLTPEEIDLLRHLCLKAFQAMTGSPVAEPQEATRR